jgi:hypothetical protein
MMGEREKIRSGRQLAAMLAAAVLLTVILLPAVNASAGHAERITDPELNDNKWIDGIFADPHNSYAWCAEVFHQDGKDYLWVGANRDMTAQVMRKTFATLGLGAMGDAVAGAMGMPVSPDAAGKIYRYDLTGDGGWELMYENENFSGYRKMVLFEGDLYVFAGLTNLDECEYSVIYRFSPGFRAGDEPEIVLWNDLPDDELEYYRAAAKETINGTERLYIGTFDGKIFYTSGATMAVYLQEDIDNGIAPSPQTDGSDGWVLIDLKAEYGLRNCVIWDIICFNGSLYAFVTGGPWEQYTGGFSVFKLTETALGVWDFEQIVGDLSDTDTRYPYGLGIEGHAMASPFLYTCDGIDYVYVSTFANGPNVMGSLLLGGLAPFMPAFLVPYLIPIVTTELTAMFMDAPYNLSESDAADLAATMAPGVAADKAKDAADVSIDALTTMFNQIYCPATIYRFGADDKWEVVVGDTFGLLNRAIDRNRDYVPNAFATDPLRAGFFPGTSLLPNISSNQYIWWMAEYEGMLYASTWDIGVFRENFNASFTYEGQLVTLHQAILMMMLAKNGDMLRIFELITDMVSGISAVIDAAMIDYASVANGIANSVSACAFGVIDAVSAWDGADVLDLYAAIMRCFSDMTNEIVDLLQGPVENLADAIAEMADVITDLYTTIVGIVDDIIQDPRKLIEIRDAITAALTFTAFVNDTSNPAGFDLFCSDDGGATWTPITVNGFGDPTNYGGRVILPTDHGLFVLTANPFNGCQIWRLDGRPLTPSIQTEGLHDSISLKKGDTYTFRIRSVGLDPDSISVIVGDGKAVSATVRIVAMDPTVYASMIARSPEPSAYGGYEWVENGWYGYEYEVTLTVLMEFDGPLSVVILVDGKQSRTTSVVLTSGAAATATAEIDWVVVAVAAAAIIIGLLCLGYFVIYLVRP